MTPSQTPRRHWSERQQQRQEQHQQQMQQHPAPQLPLDRAVADDLIDVLEACGSHPQQAQWRHIWELAGASYLDRQHRVLWWRLLHGSLMCGAYRAYIGRATPAQANCPFSCCIDPGQPQTISHLFITCPVAAIVTDWLCRLWQAMTGLFFFFFFFCYRGIVHPPSDDEGTERTWVEPEQRPRKRVPKRSVHGKQSPQGASKTFWRQDDQP